MGQGASPTAPGPEPDGPLLTPLGEFMQRRNAELGLSVAVVAQRVGMSRATWYRIARGECASPGLRLLRGLARVYKVRAAEVFALAADVDALPPTHKATAPAAHAAPEAGDALWRCRHERHVRPGAWVDVQLELLNLSDRAWVGAEVRGIHDQWLQLGDVETRPRPPSALGRGQVICRASLAPVAPGEWATARLKLHAPLTLGPSVFCLTLCMGLLKLPTGAGAILFIETR